MVKEKDHVGFLRLARELGELLDRRDRRLERETTPTQLAF